MDASLWHSSGRCGGSIHAVVEASMLWWKHLCYTCTCTGHALHITCRPCSMPHCNARCSGHSLTLRRRTQTDTCVGQLAWTGLMPLTHPNPTLLSTLALPMTPALPP